MKVVVFDQEILAIRIGITCGLLGITDNPTYVSKWV